MRSSRKASIMAAPSASSARIITEAPDRRAEEDPRCRFGTSQLLYLGSRRGPPWGRHFPPPSRGRSGSWLPSWGRAGHNRAPHRHFARARRLCDRAVSAWSITLKTLFLVALSGYGDAAHRPQGEAWVRHAWDQARDAGAASHARRGCAAPLTRATIMSN